MCNVGAGLGLAQGALQVMAGDSAYADAVKRHEENNVNAIKAAGVDFAKLGINFRQRMLAMSQQKERLQSSANKARSKAENSGSSNGLMAGRAASIVTDSVTVEASKVEGRLNQEEENALTAFALAGKDIQLRGQFRSDATDPGEPPSSVGRSGQIILGGISGFFADPS